MQMAGISLLTRTPATLIARVRTTRRRRGPTPAINASDHFDADSYATMNYRANLESGAPADAQNEYNATPELQSLLAQASAAPTVLRRRPRRV